MKITSSSFSNKAVASQSLLIACGLVSMGAQGMVPAGFGNWSADGAGIITADCPSNYKCTVEVSDNNFLQELLQEKDTSGNVKPNGNAFYRQIISDGDMTNESIVRVNNNQSSTYARHGIANKQTLGSSQTTVNADTNFSSDTILFSGWASTPGTADLQITQSIDETFRKGGANSDYLQGQFISTTNINANYDDDGNRTGFSFSVDQSLEEPGQYGGSKKSNLPDGYNEIDSQVFAMRGLEGNLLSSGSLSLNGDSLSWGAGESLWGHAIGQNFHHTELTGEGGATKGGDDPAGYEDLGVMFESYDNRSDNKAAVNYFAYFEYDVTGWPSVFGAEPDLPAPTGYNGSGDKEDSHGPSGPSPTLVSGLFSPTAVGSAQNDGRDAPIDFGQWSVEGGTVTAAGVLAEPVDASGGLSPMTGIWQQGGDGTVMPDCASGIDCETGDVVAAPGMIQRVVIDGDGKRYIQTILTDLNGGFSTESFISMADTSILGTGYGGIYTGGFEDSTAESGISMRMVLSEDTSRTGVTSSIDTEVEIKTGWAARTGTPNIDITQGIDESGPSSSSFDQQFAYNGNLDAAGNTIGSLVDIDQHAINTSAAFNGNHDSSIDDLLEFAYRSRAGNLQSNSDGVDSIDWDVGDAITATWISNSFNGDNYGVVLYDNLVDSLSYVDLGWDRKGYEGLGKDWIASAFGTAP